MFTQFSVLYYVYSVHIYYELALETKKKKIWQNFGNGAVGKPIYKQNNGKNVSRDRCFRSLPNHVIFFSFLLVCTLFEGICSSVCSEPIEKNGDFYRFSSGITMITIKSLKPNRWLEAWTFKYLNSQLWIENDIFFMLPWNPKRIHHGNITKNNKTNGVRLCLSYLCIWVFVVVHIHSQTTEWENWLWVGTTHSTQVFILSTISERKEVHNGKRISKYG